MENQKSNDEVASASINQPSDSTISPDTSHKLQPRPIRSRLLPKKPGRLSKKQLLITATVAILLIGGGTGLAYYKIHQNNAKKAAAALEASLHNSNPTKTPLNSMTNGLAFLRYQENDAYLKDGSGKPIQQLESNGTDTGTVRKDNFSVSTELNGQEHTINLDKNVFSFGASTKGEFYALSCSVPAEGAAGGDNAKYTAQFYDKSGNKTHLSSWTDQGTDAPSDEYFGCYAGNTSFSVNTTPVNFSSRNYGREPIDSLNYKVVFVAADNKKYDIDREINSDIDIPLGVSPDQKTFMYDRVSAKQVQQGCGGEVQLAYKIPDFNGTINELHAVDVASGSDSNLGSESSFGVKDHPISISAFGHFSSDSGRYYLNEGIHSGCAGGASLPIRIAYIDMKTRQLQTITSPAGKEYSQYCFNENGTYAIEYGAVDDYNDNTQPKSPERPTIRDTKDGSTFQINNVSPDFICNNGTSFSPTDLLSLDKSTYRPPGINYDRDKSLNGLTIVDPSKRTVKKIVFDQPVSVQTNGLSYGPILTTNRTIGYINRSSFSNAKNATEKAPPTVLFNLSNGNTVNIPYADIVL